MDDLTTVLVDIVRRRPIDPDGCPGCGASISDDQRNTPYRNVPGLFVCPRCHGILGKVAKYDDIAQVINLQWYKGDTSLCDTRYFDILYTNSKGQPDRIHGWFDTDTRDIVQIG